MVEHGKKFHEDTESGLSCAPAVGGLAIPVHIYRKYVTSYLTDAIHSESTISPLQNHPPQ